MKNIINIAKFTIKENFNKNSFNASILMGVLLLVMMFFLRDVLQNYKEISLKELGLFLIELVLIVTMISSFAFEIIREREEKELYLVLSKSVRREEYLIGKTLGFLLIIIVSISVLGLIHCAMLVWLEKKISFDYLVALVIVFYKVALLTSLTVLFSVIFEKATDALTCSLGLYILGYFISKIGEIFIQKSIVNIILIKMLYYGVPNFQILSYKVNINIVDIIIVYQSFYLFIYLTITSVLSIILFKNKKI